MGILKHAWRLPLGLLAGCGFAPQLDGLYGCAANGACPPGLRCSVDGRCLGSPSELDLAGIVLTSADLAGVDPFGADLASADLARATAVDLASIDLAQRDLACVAKSCMGQKWNCGSPPDGCGGTLFCGVCHGKEVCSAASPNVCGKG